MAREIYIDIGGGNGNFYKRKLERGPLSLLSRAVVRHIVLDPLVEAGRSNGVEYIKGGIYEGRKIPFEDQSISRVDTNFIIPKDDLSRFDHLMSESLRVLKTKGVLKICDYSQVIEQTESISKRYSNSLKLVDRRSPMLGERSYQVDYFLIATGSVSINDAIDFANEKQDFNLTNLVTQLMMSGDLDPEKQKDYKGYVPLLITFEKVG